MSSGAAGTGGGGAERGLEFAVLGPVRGWYGGRPLELGPVLRTTMLVALLLRPDVTVSRAELVDRVWGEHPPESDGVPGYLYQLRKSLAAGGADAKSVLRTDPGGYRFAGAGVEVDAVRVDEIAARAKKAAAAGALAAAAEGYGQALAFYEGVPLAGLPGPFAERERRRFAERRIGLVEGRTDALIRLGDYASAISEVSALLAEHPDREPLTGLLMRALYGAGRPSDALDTWREFRVRMRDELGLEPSEDLRRVHEAVLRGDDGALAVAPRPAAAPRIRDELPHDVGELAGRDDELARLAAPGSAVSAVDGVPGAGKTALAVRAAQLLREEHPDGCLFVGLHGHSTSRAPLAPVRVLRRLLRSAGVNDQNIPDDLDELSANWRAATAPLRLVVVLDDALSAEQVRPLLPGGTGNRVLITSRRRLPGLDVERRISLGPLTSDAAAGLLSRIVGPARASRERAAVRELASLCGRLPLALRIAGARLQNRPMWTFRDLVDRLADDTGRLGELTAEERSVEAAFRLSYDQLPADTRRAFRTLGRAPAPEFDELVLAAMLGCSRRAAESVLEDLVDANLVQAPAAGRYRMHDLVAVYARRLVADEPDVASGLEVYLHACRAASEWDEPGFPSGPAPTASPFSGLVDASAWLDRAGDLVEVVSAAAAAGHPDYACWIAEGAVDYLVRRIRYRECVALLEVAVSEAANVADRRMTTALRFGLGWAHLALGDSVQARQWCEEGLRISRENGDRRGNRAGPVRAGNGRDARRPAGRSGTGADRGPDAGRGGGGQLAGRTGGLRAGIPAFQTGRIRTLARLFRRIAGSRGFNGKSGDAGPGVQPHRQRPAASGPSGGSGGTLARGGRIGRAGRRPVVAGEFAVAAWFRGAGIGEPGSRAFASPASAGCFDRPDVAVGGGGGPEPAGGLSAGAR
ncbi:AfsR/SARP family transcriptional regulator [Amycolatopsis rubida]|uniref:AfsR/SARP family transcriptional regulator n=1 Tax=Amycolatopsis rubida TaxID=112413 RepID=A0ABX0BRW5_9PSEU|nr:MULTISPECIES: BTAD domain-containing putative transcriptional regulator [Amycolatopsis]MYW91388.1 AfsR/SARP family transcriptional regulator [Amycolatopsis rubida]NEC56373.1 AfsR/SARP family transcriptional regulator [Amycolatopsis rubida]OAP28971.1 Regulatory protein AfsR [Amycolatopsis sp. M39]